MTENKRNDKVKCKFCGKIVQVGELKKNMCEECQIRWSLEKMERKGYLKTGKVT